MRLNDLIFYYYYFFLKKIKNKKKCKIPLKHLQYFLYDKKKKKKYELY